MANETRANETLTEQQKNWMAKVRASLESSTGKSIDEWMAIAAQNPETRPRARLAWLKENHGLGQNYAMMVQHALAEAQGAPLRDTDSFRATLWAKPADLAVLEAIERSAAGFDGLVTGQRKGFTAWSRKHQFAAARPAPKSGEGAVRLGLAVSPEADPRLEPAKNEGWSERLLATIVLKGPTAVDASVAALLKAAYDRS